MTQPEITYAWKFNPRHAVNNEPIPKAQCTARCGDNQQTYEISYQTGEDSWEVQGWDEESEPTGYIGDYRDLKEAQAAIPERAAAAKRERQRQSRQDLLNYCAAQSAI